MTQHCNVLIGCDQLYYEQWGILLLKSIKRYNPWMKLHVHIVNPNKKNDLLKDVDYSFETREFSSDQNKIGYLQCCRFLAVNNKFTNSDLVMTLDTDTICTRATSPEYFTETAKNITILRHHKDRRWLAGMVTFGQNDFRQQFVKQLHSLPVESWKPFHDQNALQDLSSTYQFVEQNDKDKWMKYGKNAEKGIFMTLKGNQKNAHKYLEVYNKIKMGI